MSEISPPAGPFCHFDELNRIRCAICTHKSIDTLQTRHLSLHLPEHSKDSSAHFLFGHDHSSSINVFMNCSQPRHVLNLSDVILYADLMPAHSRTFRELKQFRVPTQSCPCWAHCLAVLTCNRSLWVVATIDMQGERRIWLMEDGVRKETPRNVERTRTNSRILERTHMRDVTTACHV